jgi:hypothetical protein
MLSISGTLSPYSHPNASTETCPLFGLLSLWCHSSPKIQRDALSWYSPDLLSPLDSAVSVYYHEVEQHHAEVLSGSSRCGPGQPSTSSTKAPQLQLHGVHGSVSGSGSSLANGSGIQERCGHNLLVNNCGRSSILCCIVQVHDAFNVVHIRW